MIPWNKGALLYMVCDHVSCVLRSNARTDEVRAVLRRFVPYKGLHPLRRCAAIPAYFAAGTICFQQTVPAAKSKNPI